ncbi:MAG TPA: hydrogen gas-evolving membrane-bound hydrogenase subunit E [Acidimicrobiales bacterium]|nr:hydrogen gas-evolving membrane-bound hydrogenase subunit E [Acidimicrobiales bacterium]
MSGIILVFLLASGGAFLLSRRPRLALATAAVPLVATGLWLAWLSARVLDGERFAAQVSWVPSLGVDLSFRVDGFGWLLGLIISGVGLVVLGYAAGYFGDVNGRRTARFAGLLTIFAGAMCGVVLADDVWTLFVFWEITSVTSFLLIGLDDRTAGARFSALRALLVTSMGGLAMLGGFALLVGEVGSSSFAAVRGADVTEPQVAVALVLVLVGAFTKSAQVPFHFWLPGAMAAPTPVSAYLHSATMVKAGVVLVARFAPVFVAAGWWRPILLTVGAATMFLGGLEAMRQHDAKLLLAFGTVSQLGLLMLLFGAGWSETTAAGVALLVAHALFKAALFLAVGVVDHATGTRDVTRLSGVGRRLPWLAAAAGVAAASMAGLPPTFGFVAKEGVIASVFEAPGGWGTFASVAVVGGSVLTVAYSWRWWVGVFGTKTASTSDLAVVGHEPGLAVVAPVTLLAVLSIVLGLAAAPVGDVLGAVSESLDPGQGVHLALWPGWHPPLFASIAIVGAGLALDRFTRRVWSPSRDTAVAAFQRTFDSLTAGAKRTAGIVQSGSLPAYTAVVFTVVAVAAATPIALGARLEGNVDIAASPWQAATAALVTAFAVAVATARRRFVAVLLLGGVGYGLALVFFLAGAADLALTQVLVETLMIVVFLLVLRWFPDLHRPAPASVPRWIRSAIATGVGASAAAFAAIAATARSDRPVTDEMAARAVDEAGGRNLVNVIIVDFRGFDTLGEIAVLGIAAIGVANLVRTHAVPRRDIDTPRDRSVIMATVVRGLFPFLMVTSIWLTVRGHNALGGGFAGGLVAAAAFLLRFLADGEPPLRRVPRAGGVALVAVGLALAVITALAGLIGGAALESGIASIDLPRVGPVKAVSSTVFDIGVYLLVIGAALAVIRSLGAEPVDSEREVVA